MPTQGLSAQNRRLLAWLAALGAAGVAAAVTLTSPVTAAGKQDPTKSNEAIGYTLPAGWTDQSKFQPQFVAHKAPMCFYQDGDVSKCYVMVEGAGSSTPLLDEMVNSMVGPCLSDRARPTVSMLNQETRQIGGHQSEHTRWTATCTNGESMGVQADYLSDIGILIWSDVDSVYSEQVDNAGVESILSSLTFAGAKG